MPKNENAGIVMNIGGIIVVLAIVVPLLKVLETGIVADAMSLELMGLIMVIATILCVIPVVNIHFLISIGPYVSEQLAIWGTAESWHTTFFFALGFLSMLLVSLIFNILLIVLLYAVFNSLRGDKRTMSKARGSVKEIFRFTRRG